MRKYLTVVFFSVLIACGRPPEKPVVIVPKPDTREIAMTTCIHHTGISVHYHSYLSIFINGEAQDIPPEIGIQIGCWRPLHTHDGSGAIHIEALQPADFTLGDFFAVWNKDFSATKILGRAVDATHVIRMTVNGQPNLEFDKYVLQNGAYVEIRYERL